MNDAIRPPARAQPLLREQTRLGTERDAWRAVQPENSRGLPKAA
jgi:hypothetical protein